MKRLNSNIYFQTYLTLCIVLTSICHLAAQIESTDYHIQRGEMSNSFAKLSENKNVKIAFLGGSITYNPGWRDSTCAYIQKRFPNAEVEFIAAGIPSMGSTPGAFRLERDILSKGKIDLLFVEAAVNDPTNGRNNKEQIRAMEGIVRHARLENTKIDVIAMYFVDPDKMKTYDAGNIPQVITNHDRVASHYEVSSINLAKEVTDRINAGEFSWENDFKDLHPSPFGQIIYFNSIKAFLDKAWSEKDITSQRTHRYTQPPKLDRYCYDQGQLLSIEQASISNGWEIIDDWAPTKGENTRPGYVNVPMLCADQSSAELTLEFKGKAIGIAVAAGPDAGMIEYSIDGSDFKKMDLYTKWSGQLHLPWYYVLEAELSSKKHTMTMRISESSNPESKGNACRIKHFFINE